MLKPFNIKAPDFIKNAGNEEGFKIYAADERAELLIMDDIGKDIFGDGIAASDVVGFLGNNKGPVNVRINSFGGSFYEGLVIYNAMLQHDAEITATIEGIAFSAATLPAMGADRLVMNKQSDFGIHRAWTIAAGNQHDMRDAGEWLEGVDNHLLEVYSEKSGQPTTQIMEWLDGTSDGTVFNAEAALEAGFADEVLGPKRAETAAKKQQASAAKGIAAAAKIRRQRLKASLK